MKKICALLPILVFLRFFSSCISLESLWPNVAGPIDNEASLLVVEAGIAGEGALFNSNASGWAPWVVDAQGEVVPFKTFDGEPRLDSFFYSENLESGKYTLKGFFHVYIDYSKLPAEVIALYAPFDDYSYHVKQEFPLDEPVEVNLGKGEVATLGRYFITYSWTEGLTGTTDQRWRVNPSSVIISGDKSDKKALRVAQNWRTPHWTLWNLRNSEAAADN
ncbi:MAG: hypothetical protein WC224_00915 [Sphaerochaetaceae bacterium]